MTTGHVRPREVAPPPCKTSFSALWLISELTPFTAQLTAHLGALTPLTTPNISSLLPTVSWQGQETTPQGAHTECFGAVIWQKETDASRAPGEVFKNSPPGKLWPYHLTWLLTLGCFIVLIKLSVVSGVAQAWLRGLSSVSHAISGAPTLCAWELPTHVPC